jgi:hypothetical protein
MKLRNGIYIFLTLLLIIDTQAFKFNGEDGMELIIEESFFKLLIDEYLHVGLQIINTSHQLKYTHIIKGQELHKIIKILTFFCNTVIFDKVTFSDVFVDPNNITINFSEGPDGKPLITFELRNLEANIMPTMTFCSITKEMSGDIVISSIKVQATPTLLDVNGRKMLTFEVKTADVQLKSLIFESGLLEYIKKTFASEELVNDWIKEYLNDFNNLDYLVWNLNQKLKTLSLYYPITNSLELDYSFTDQPKIIERVLYLKIKGTIYEKGNYASPIKIEADEEKEKEKNKCKNPVPKTNLIKNTFIMQTIENIKTVKSIKNVIKRKSSKDLDLVLNDSDPNIKKWELEGSLKGLPIIVEALKDKINHPITESAHAENQINLKIMLSQEVVNSLLNALYYLTDFSLEIPQINLSPFAEDLDQDKTKHNHSGLKAFSAYAKNFVGRNKKQNLQEETQGENIISDGLEKKGVATGQKDKTKHKTKEEKKEEKAHKDKSKKDKKESDKAKEKGGEGEKPKKDNKLKKAIGKLKEHIHNKFGLISLRLLKRPEISIDKDIISLKNVYAKVSMYTKQKESNYDYDKNLIICTIEPELIKLKASLEEKRKLRVEVVSIESKAEDFKLIQMKGSEKLSQAFLLFFYKRILSWIQNRINTMEPYEINQITDKLNINNSSIDIYNNVIVNLGLNFDKQDQKKIEEEKLPLLTEKTGLSRWNNGFEANIEIFIKELHSDSNFYKRLNLEKVKFLTSMLRFNKLLLKIDHLDIEQYNFSTKFFTQESIGNYYTIDLTRFYSKLTPKNHDEKYIIISGYFYSVDGNFKCYIKIYLERDLNLLEKVLKGELNKDKTTTSSLTKESSLKADKNILKKDRSNKDKNDEDKAKKNKSHKKESKKDESKKNKKFDFKEIYQRTVDTVNHRIVWNNFYNPNDDKELIYNKRVRIN